jgi:hypothetical protein
LTLITKSISIRKSTDFSDRSKVLLHIGEKTFHIKGFNSFSFEVAPENVVFASQDWTSSNRLAYEQLESNAYLIKPRLTKKLAFWMLVVTSICFLIFIFAKWRWSFLPLIPFAFYILLYLSLLRKKYLIIVPDK